LKHLITNFKISKSERLIVKMLSAQIHNFTQNLRHSDSSVSAPIAIEKLGVRSTATEWIVVALLEQERSHQLPRQKANVRLPLSVNHRHAKQILKSQLPLRRCPIESPIQLPDGLPAINCS